MADKLNQASAAYHGSYGQGLAMGTPAYQHLNAQNINLPGQSAYVNMQSLKTALPTTTPSSVDLGNTKRLMQNSPMMVMPSGQTVPLSAFYAQTQNQSNNDNYNSLPFMSAGMMPGFISNAGYAAAPMTQLGWPYNLPANGTDVDNGRRGYLPVNEENIPINAAMNIAMQQDIYSSFPYTTHPATSGGQQYVAGPIQPIKTQDNKGYELVNLEELVSRDPPIPRAVPALWTNQEDLTLAKCLQNPEGITNVYVRGFMPDTTDEDLDHWASRFGEIESCKAIIDQDTGKCKGFGFVMYYSPASAENCIRGFFHLGFQASYAQKSRNSRLKDLEDRTSTNIYCTGVPIDWNESDLAKHFLPYNAVSTKICRDSPSGVSKEVGFARFETREIAERVIKDFHSLLTEHDGVKLYLRFADTKAQKTLKLQSQERRQWRSREYSYSVEHTPSPITGRVANLNHISPNGSYQSPAGVGNSFTPATSVSPPEIANANKFVAHSRSGSSWPTQGGLQSITNTSISRPQHTTASHSCSYPEAPQKNDTIISIKSANTAANINRTPSPKKIIVKIEPTSGKENITVSPSSVK